MSYNQIMLGAINFFL